MRKRIVIYILIFMSVGTALAVVARAATFSAAKEAEAGSISGNARSVSQASASASTAVTFGGDTAGNSAMMLGTMINRGGGGPAFAGIIKASGTRLYREEDNIVATAREARAAGADILPIIANASTAGAYAKEFKPHWVEVGNETFAAGMSASAYFSELKAVYQAVKAASPSTQVIMSGTASVQGGGNWMATLKQLGAEQYMDEVAIHPYVLPHNAAGSPYDIEAVSDTHAMFPTKKVAVTEVGWPTGGGSGYTPVVSQSTQATYLQQTVDKLAALGYVSVVIIYRWDNVGNTSSIEGYFGIAGKPAASVFTKNAATYPLY